MITLDLTGTQKDIMHAMALEHPELGELHRKVYDRVSRTKREVAPYQASVIYHLASQYNGGYALEIGTAMGYSLYFLCEALPGAWRIVSLNPKMKEYHWGVKAVLPYHYAQVVAMRSWDYLKIYDGGLLDFILVDGDHDQVERDTPWFNHLSVDGLILFHDYSPENSKRPNQHVVDILDRMAGKLKRPFDVKVVDSRNVGMVGFYRREGEVFEG